MTIADDLLAELRGVLWDRLAPLFARRDTRGSFRDLVDGLLMELETRNCWTIAEAVGHRTPDRLQHLLSRGSWEERAVLDAVADWAVGHLGPGETGLRLLIADETGDAKSSTDCVGASHQYSGAIGGVGLCQVAVHLAYATVRGHAIIDRALYLPENWAADEERRDLAGVPEEELFATKPAQALGLLRRALARGIRAEYFTGDEVYGGHELRCGVRELGLGYVVAVKASQRVTLPSGRRVKVVETTTVLPKGSWHRMRTGTGGKGAKDYDWAMLAVRPDDTPPGRDPHGESVLLIRRHRYTRTLSFYLCWSPRPVSLAMLVSIVCRRWRIEELFQGLKGAVGLDQGQTSRWTSWHRWTTASLTAYALLAVAAALAHTDHDPERDGLVALTTRELQRLLRLLLLPVPRRDRAHGERWSYWRRRHQYRARRAHHHWHTYADQVPETA